MHVYMEVTKDKYELPIAVADSARELSEICGVSKEAIYSSISKKKHGTHKTSRFLKVEIDEQEHFKQT